MANFIVGKDVDISFEKKGNGDIRDFTSIDAVRSSIHNIILTTKGGERRYLPEFADNLGKYLFEPMDEVTAYQIGERVLEAIERGEPRVIVEHVRVIPDYQGNQYRVLVNFRIRAAGYSEVEQVETILRRG